MLHRLFGRRSAAADRWDHQRPLLHLAKRDPWTLGNALEGTLVTGGTGSGKSSTTIRQITLAMLRAGFGGICLTVKVDDGPQFVELARAAGRGDDLLVVNSASHLRLNPIDDEASRKGPGAGQTHNIVSLLLSVIEAADRRGQRSSVGGGSDPFWNDAKMMVLHFAVDGVKFAAGTLSIDAIQNFIESAPKSAEQAESPEWKARSFCYQCLRGGELRISNRIDARDFDKCVTFWVSTFPALPEKTRQSIVMSVTAAINVINRGVINELFGTTNNLSLESTFDGKLIVFDLPVKEYGEAGTVAQCLAKRHFQMTVERRRYDATQRPVMLVADEAQFFFNSHDTLFQTTARGSGCATLYATQNIPNCHAAFGGGDVGKAQAESLLGNLNTKFFHANADVATNEYASQLIGRSKQFLFNANTSHGPSTFLSRAAGDPQSGQLSSGLSETFEHEVQPSAFTRLRTGGVSHRRFVDVIVFQNGRQFRASGKTWLPVTFRQE
jgi:hypothetical protein